MTTDLPVSSAVPELEPALRNLYDAALVARAYIAERHEAFESALLAGPAGQARERLDALDAALADAGELLASVTS